MRTTLLFIDFLVAGYIGFLLSHAIHLKKKMKAHEKTGQLLSELGDFNLEAKITDIPEELKNKYDLVIERTKKLSNVGGRIEIMNEL